MNFLAILMLVAYITGMMVVVNDHDDRITSLEKEVKQLQVVK